MAGKIRREDIPKIIADALGLSHFIVANLIIILGEATQVLADLGGEHPGLTFVFNYLDLPVYYLLKGYIGAYSGGSFWTTFMLGQLVVILSSLVYGLIIYIILRVVTDGD